MKQFSMMKTIALAAVMTVAAISVAQPQGGPQGGPRGGGGPGQVGGPGMGRPGIPGGLLILNMKTVQQELKITPEQDKQIDELTLQVMRRGGGPGGPGGPGFGGGGGGRPPMEGEEEVFAQQGGRGQGQGRGQGGPGFGPGQGPGQGQGFEGPLAKILNERQLARHRQLTLQWDAPMAFMRPDVGQKLDLNENQRREISEIIRSMMPPPGGQGGPGGPGFGGPGQGQGQGGRGQGGRGQGGQRPPFEGDDYSGLYAQQAGPRGGGFGAPGQGPGGPGGPGANFDEMLKRKQEAARKAFGVLTDGQKKIWGEMTGARFDKWVAPELPRPQGGPGGPGGQGGPGLPPPPPLDDF